MEPLPPVPPDWEIPPEVLKKLRAFSSSEWYVVKRVGEQDFYVGVIDGKLTWTSDRSKRLKLCRQEDAQAIESLFPDAQLCVNVTCE